MKTCKTHTFLSTKNYFTLIDVSKSSIKTTYVKSTSKKYFFFNTAPQSSTTQTIQQQQQQQKVYIKSPSIKPKSNFTFCSVDAFPPRTKRINLLSDIGRCCMTMVFFADEN